MRAHLKRLATTSLAYQLGEIVAKAVALITLPLYTRYVRPTEYGAASLLLTLVILVSIVVRLGTGEGYVRLHFDDEDEQRRKWLAGSSAAVVAWVSTAIALLVVAFSGLVSKLVLGYTDRTLIDCAALGLWAFTNLEMAYAQLRATARTRLLASASVANVLLTVCLTLLLVVVAHLGARGLLLGNFGASTIVLIVLWATRRTVVHFVPQATFLAAMLAFGLPTVPADASIYSLQVVDRIYLARALSVALLGTYAVALQLATVMLLVTRGFQNALPPIAYSIESDEIAANVFASVATYFALGSGLIVVSSGLLAPWIVSWFAAPAYAGASSALPWLTLGWALYGLYIVLVAIAGRAKATSRNVVAAAAGLLANAALLVTLVPASGAGLGLAGAGIALCGGYGVMLAVLYRLTRSLSTVTFEWVRLAEVILVDVSVVVSGRWLLPSAGALGFILRLLWLGLVPLALLALRFFTSREIAAGRTALNRVGARLRRVPQ